MKKWKNKAAPDDPNVWADVSCMWPTPQGTYEVADFHSTSTNLTATGETASGSGTGISAWAFNGLSSQRIYLIGAKIWQLSGGSLTDRTGGITVGSARVMAQYGDVSILARGTGQSLASSTGGNFSALAGSPSAKIVVVQSNAVVAFNTSTSSDQWVASDVGDYTNWTTGEAASGRIIDRNGPITAAVAFGNDILVFKEDAIYRMTYVGGPVKWQVQKAWDGVGCYIGSDILNQVVACGDCVLFVGRVSSSPNNTQIYRFDGSSAPVHISAETDLGFFGGAPCYDPAHRRVMFVDYNAASVVPYYYHLDRDAWGRGNDLYSSIGVLLPLVLRGDHSAACSINSNINSSARPIFCSGTDLFKQFLPIAPGGSTASSAYVQTPRMGAVDRKTAFSRATPLLRRRVSNSGGSPACSLSATFYRERHDTSAASTQSVSESSTRKRFDFLASDNFGQFKVTFTDMDAEVDDVLVVQKPAGVE
jgi:hypothetical protein